MLMTNSFKELMFLLWLNIIIFCPKIIFWNHLCHSANESLGKFTEWLILNRILERIFQKKRQKLWKSLTSPDSNKCPATTLTTSIQLSWTFLSQDRTIGHISVNQIKYAFYNFSSSYINFKNKTKSLWMKVFKSSCYQQVIHRIYKIKNKN